MQAVSEESENIKKELGWIVISVWLDEDGIKINVTERDEEKKAQKWAEHLHQTGSEKVMVVSVTSFDGKLSLK